MAGDGNEKINFYIDIALLEEEGAAVSNKTAAIARALKVAYLNRSDFIAFVRAEMLRDLPATADMRFRDIIIKGRLRYNTCLRMGACETFLLRGSEVKYRNGALGWNGGGSGWNFCFLIPGDTKVIFEHHENDFSSETLCALIIL